ncbi:MAG TPA: cysteine dioxygenase family protein [Jatrophihabitans sp.]|nr:cysteine dioxygenase family protein [Jatrophihabitans sp.]
MLQPVVAAPRVTLFLDPVQLVEFTRFIAAEVRGGRYPYVRYDAEQRWHQRLYRDRRVDVWLISWLPAQGTQLHDHGGSSGAFTVLDGALTEAVYRPGSRDLVEVARPAGDSVGFGAHYVHDVRNLSERPAVSVHAYSAPLTSMNFYDLDGGAGLSRLLTVATDDPEPAVDVSPGSRPRSA